ncbi:tetratricopeptide repeat-containing sensor histidine kinase [Marivirga salinae]|uniref:histidine kinase n=1 Tax=Marivirga salinarum TaxID=3059078 RepID=A0AA51RE20_9BACT|nr:tetratricopeptide repeat-containing sensor histidine kinase [Marivirga sp. BDSF4-3]WMN10785.1 tetratricopeptide repeat-containing sensor histidine kinase [Marivirga sp. BDSF4-3]
MSKKAILILTFFSISTCYLHAQNSTIVSDWNWFKALEEHISTANAEELLENKQEKLQSAKDIDRNDIESKISKELAFIHIHKTNNLEKAMALLIRALEIDESTENESALIFTYIGFYQLFEQVEDYYYGKEFLEKASNLLRNYNIPPLRLYINQNLGYTYYATGETGKSIEQHQNILQYAKAERIPKIEAKAHTDLADIYANENVYDKALIHYKNALDTYRRIKSPLQEAECLNAIGDIYLMQDNSEKAYENYVVALDILTDIKNAEAQLAALYNSVGRYYLKKNNAERALANLRLANPLAQSSQNQELVQETYALLSKTYKDLGDYKNALDYSELFKALDDFLQKEKNDRSILKMQSRYSINQKQSLIDQLELNRIQKEFELEEEKRFKNFLIIMVALIAIILLLILTLFIVQRKNNSRLKAANLKVKAQNDELEDLNATKDKFFSIISHDLKGPLNSLTSFSGLLMNHTSSLSTEEIQMLAKDLDKSIKNLFTLLENLLQWSRSQTGNIEFTAEEFDLIETLNENKKLLEKQAENKNINIEVKNTKSITAKAHPNSITTVIRNLLSNAIKFTEEGGQIKMGVVEEKNRYVVKIADNGVGMPKEVANKIFRIDTKHSTQGTAKEKGTGLGLILCKEFVEKNGGEIWVKSEEGKGTIFSFSIPK